MFKKMLVLIFSAVFISIDASVPNNIPVVNPVIVVAAPVIAIIPPVNMPVAQAVIVAANRPARRHGYRRDGGRNATVFTDEYARTNAAVIAAIPVVPVVNASVAPVAQAEVVGAGRPVRRHGYRRDGGRNATVFTDEYARTNAAVIAAIPVVPVVNAAVAPVAQAEVVGELDVVSDNE